MKSPIRIILVEDSPEDSNLILLELRRANFDPDWRRVDTESEFRSQLGPEIDLILSDYSMPSFSGLRALEVIRECGQEIPFILVSGVIGEETAVTAMRNGASDYLLKSRLDRLGLAVERALRQGFERRERRRAEEALRAKDQEQRELFRQLTLERTRLLEAQLVAKVGSWETDFDTQIVQWSLETYRIFDVVPEQFQPTHQRFLEMVHPEDRAAVDAAFLKSGTQTGVFRIEHRILPRGGGIKFVEERWKVVDSDAGTGRRAIGTCQDITHRHAIEETLRVTGAQLREFARRLQVVREEERTAVAREIHDVLAQELTRLKLDLSWLERRLRQPVSDVTRNDLLQKVSSMMELADVTIESVQRLATELRPVVLDSLGLGPAIQWLAEEFQNHNGIPCEVSLGTDIPLMERAQATALFRIVQECLTNVVRHAGAQRVEVSLGLHEGNLCLQISDNGCGISPAALLDFRSIGLLGMRERAALLGGETQIQRLVAGGTQVRVTMPLQALDLGSSR